MWLLLWTCGHPLPGPTCSRTGDDSSWRLLPRLHGTRIKVGDETAFLTGLSWPSLLTGLVHRTQRSESEVRGDRGASEKGEGRTVNSNMASAGGGRNTSKNGVGC